MDIRLEQVGKRYGDVEVVVGLDLTLASGRVVALLGPSGCGKTTTLRMIAGLERPTSGRLSIGGVVVDDGAVFVPPERRGLGMVFQSYALWPHKSVVDNVAYPLALRGLGGATRRDKALQALTRVRLEHLAERMPFQLSGGQQQRVAVARAVVGDGDRSPPVLLLDEPLANLDAKLREEMRGELSTLARQSGATVVLVTHDQQEAFAVADEVVVLDKGRLAQQGTPLDIYERPASPFVGAFGGPMAFLDGELDEVRVVVDGAALSRARCVLAPGTPSSGPVTVGVRPEWLAPGASGVPTTVVQRLFLGREHELALKTSSQRSLLVRVPSLETPPAVGDALAVQLHKAVLFPRAT
jgi:ABC-type sugar transport system ATPase subunit